MMKQGAKAKPLQLVLGWVIALLLLVMAGIYIHHIAGRELIVMLCVDGEPLCRVENQGVVERALLLLEEKRSSSGIRDEVELSFSYRYVLENGQETVDAEACMELLHERAFSHYSRAYMILVQGMEIAACATYGEAEQVVERFRAYIVEWVLDTSAEADLVRLTTEFEIKSVFCREDRIASCEDIYRVMVGTAGHYRPSVDEQPIGTRVPAVGSSSLLYADKNADFGLIRNPVSGSAWEDRFSLNLSGLNAVISYQTVIVETHSEIIVHKTEYIESDTLYIGQTEVDFEGENGLAENVYEIAYADGVEVSRTLVSSKVIASPKNRVERIGTKEYPSTKPTGSFAWPLSGFQITSYYGLCRPGLDSYGQFHYGVDLAGPKLGEPIYAADGGEVIFAGDNGSYGLMVKIRHEDRVMTYYAHMSALSVKEGDRVYKGQKVGEIGRTGTATGVHLHFEVRIDGKTVDPLNYLPQN